MLLIKSLNYHLGNMPSQISQGNFFPPTFAQFVPVSQNGVDPKHSPLLHVQLVV